MNVTLTVSSRGTGPGGGAVHDLRRWLQRHPELRALIRQEPAAEPEPGTMGAASELLTLLLAPGGATAALGAAVVAWLQNRRGNQTVTITRPDGTQITVTSERVRDLSAGDSGEVARRLAEALEPRDPGTAATGTAATGTAQPDPASRA
ncbi:effector-associated constant component EACC1 [Streptomyces sp. URMC 124]|uniref:effector-associated constant component EACC1 n=1 Tax=Streptomyces sp. URMC 124 TaxID=3423405 RepID=UPI003F1D57CB